MAEKISDGMNAKERYDKKNLKKVTIAFNLKTESHLLEELDKQSNKARFIKDLIQKEIDSKK